MSVSRDDVICAYRFVLGRDPESFSLIDELRSEEDWRTLRERFISSAEYSSSVAKAASNREIGRFLDVNSMNIEVKATSDQLYKMFERIAKNWRAFGDEEPHFSVLTNPIFKPDSIAENIERFLQSGQFDIERLLNFPRRAGVFRSPYRRALDFGCGVGRLSIALSPYCDEVIGADISSGHLREMKDLVDKHRINNVLIEQLTSVGDIVSMGKFDLVISRIVLQHNPPPVIAEIYRNILKCLESGGVAIVQVPTYIQEYKFDIEHYLASENVAMEMNAIPQREIFRIIAEEGCITLEIREDDNLGEVEGLSHVIAVQKL